MQFEIFVQAFDTESNGVLNVDEMTSWKNWMQQLRNNYEGCYADFNDEMFQNGKY